MYWLRTPSNSDITPTSTGALDESANTTSGTTESNEGTPTGTTLSVGGEVTTGAPMTASVTYTGTAYTPSTVTIKKGGTVTFTSATPNMWVASAQHPTHSAYSGTSRAEHCAASYSGAAPFDQCTQGSSFSFKFDKTGTFPYHDHVNASVFGKVIVE